MIHVHVSVCKMVVNIYVNLSEIFDIHVLYQSLCVQVKFCVKKKKIIRNIRKEDDNVVESESHPYNNQNYMK